ncbi:MAG: cobaltochelatase subunit CobN [Geminicoccaceae bacterium]
MHLLRAQSGVIDDGGEAVDLGIDPADILVLSHADTELALLARAREQLTGTDVPSLRLAPLGRLRHHMSVDVFVERTVERSRLVILRLLGGEPSWPYGVERITSLCRRNNIPLAVLPGDDRPDPQLDGLSTIDRNRARQLWAYLTEGGGENARNFLLACRHLLDGGPEPEPARPVARAGIHHRSSGDGPKVAIIFYRSLLLAEDLEPVEKLARALEARGLAPLTIFVASLKDPASAAFLDDLFVEYPIQCIVNLTSFAVSAAGSMHEPTPLDLPGVPVLQAVLASGTRESWVSSTQGLNARDLAMGVVLPELDGRIFTRAIGFKSAARRSEITCSDIVALEGDSERAAFVAAQAEAWIRLRTTPASERKVAIVLANYPNQNARIANGVGLDSPESAVGILRHLVEAGYALDDPPASSAELMHRLLGGRKGLAHVPDRPRLAIEDYGKLFASLPEALQSAVIERWGEAKSDPALVDGSFFFPDILELGSITIGIQPARGYNIDPKGSYHDPALVPPHNYLAFYFWLRHTFDAHAVVHLGKHGNLEWLPGKALALDACSWPEAVLGPLPHLYPFIVNDPGEGSQAKRRSSAVIIDHLTPPLTRAETYGPLRDLEALVDEYFDASGQDPRRLALLKREIIELMSVSGLDRDLGIEADADSDEAFEKLDAYLCELKEAQIRDGLHIFGESPRDRLETDLLAALARSPDRNVTGHPSPGLTQALAEDFLLAFDPLDCTMGETWSGPKPAILMDVTDAPWRSTGDTVERLELFVSKLIDGSARAPGPTSRKAMERLDGHIRPVLRMSGPAEMEALLRGLNGQFVPPGPAGAPTRGRLDVLPTGRNFYSVDTRSVPTPAAWQLGQASAARLLERYRQDHGRWPARMGLSAWGTANMRTGGDDIAQALALMGAKPTWDNASRRVTGFEIIPLSLLDRPRVDVTFRVSGFFRDAFPGQMDLIDSAARAIMELDEPAKSNPLRARFLEDRERLIADGVTDEEASDRASYRVFGSMPGAYGAGLQAMFDERLWNERADLADAYLVWGSYAYGRGRSGVRARAQLEQRLASLDAVIQNQDNREHDILDSDDYYQFQGGMTVAAHELSGQRPAVFLNDHSNPSSPRIRSLEEEIARVVRARVVNPKWIRGVMRHGYKGAFEMNATVDYLFAYAVTTGAVADHHFDLVHDAYLADEEVRAFLAEANPDALLAIAAKLNEAIERGIWKPRRNSTRATLETIEETTRP